MKLGESPLVSVWLLVSSRATPGLQRWPVSSLALWAETSAEPAQCVCGGCCGLELPGVHSNLSRLCGGLHWCVCHPDCSTAALPCMYVFGKGFVLALELFSPTLTPSCLQCEWHTTCWCGLSAVRSLLHWMCSHHKLLLAGGDQKNTCEYAAGIPYVRDLSRGECVEQCRSSIHKKTLSSRVF